MLTTSGPIAEAPSTSGTGPIVFYDGLCGLCNRLVHFTIRRDPRARFRFAPLQGTTLEAVGLGEYRDKLDTMVVFEGGRAYTRSDAALRVLRRLRWPWSWLGFIGVAVPRLVREALYRWVARNRNRWFRPLESCPTPQSRDLDRFLP